MKSKTRTVPSSWYLTLTVVLLLAGCKENVDKAIEPYPAARPNVRRSTTNELAAADERVADIDNRARTNLADRAVTDADNSAMNVRDRDTDATLTSGDQGESEADRTLTQEIRKLVVSGTNEFSMAAKNIKIITTNGKVTLRGPVDNAAEKMAIAKIAADVAGIGNVDDQLEVKTNP